MFWDIAFWLLLALTILPLPFKIVGYVKRTDKSSLGVKIEEIANTMFMALGLVAFYGYLNNQVYLFSNFWLSWLVIAVIWSIGSLFFSPKLTYATEVMGKNKMRLFALLGVALYLPLYFAVYFYAVNT